MFLNDANVIRIAQERNTTPGQVALSWGVQRGTVVIPKSENPERMKQNISVRPVANPSPRWCVLTVCDDL